MNFPRSTKAKLGAIAGLFSSINAYAAGGGVQFISYYQMLLNTFGISDEHVIEEWKPVLGAAFTLIITLLIGLKYRAKVAAAGDDVTPDAGFSVRSIMEMIMDFVHNLGKGIIGETEVRPYLSVLFGLFLFILISNVSGLVPGFTPATESISTNLALGLFIFIVFNIAGVKEHGVFGYLKTFAGPMAIMAPFIFSIEMIGSFVRPVSLALRLYGNIFGDHLVLSVFTGLTYLVLPSFLLFFGLMVACLQSFVFTLLSGIYISLAVSHDH
ncbi:F0F1 ATP synthase subunit A [Pseudobacteriovorax antillogorgiicola]|uniref:ATP synthase subunit a n=1 Tax=Pseudobacteriovorax antillogorgiicola TaxID=1513793 RepID=A0A1Y6B970_9BACT|nr:F0F1 ATP synthase subunit A [Pseudobacteriovorax antillogorgiicola]TCS59149.1 ATP synthase F0 subcomplex A subunit [Pseudobacteriovorax antillogorgiicola]SME91237.1 F-type H+-transporting ATPase subunit a [Pseudobacteriovorax antillogorgiicola]